MIKKRCQIQAQSPITCFSVPIIGFTELNLTHDEIYSCLCAKAEVTEILKDGTTVALNFSNYNKDNSKGEPIEEVKAPVEEVQEEVVNNTEPSDEIIEEEETVEVTDKVEVEETVEEAVESVEETTEKPEEEPTDDTVKDYNVEPRNTTSYKKAKNNRK